MNTGIFSRNVPGTTERLQGVCVGIAGCGGLGSNVAVALTRAGVGRLILADMDRVEASNLNRQHFFLSDIGRFKTDALAAHLRAINPEIGIDMHANEVTPDNMAGIFGQADILVEAFDRAEAKAWLIRRWHKLFPDRPMVAANGLSGYGASGTLHLEQFGKLVLCGDMTTDMAMGLAAPRVLMVAAMQANAVIELVMDGRTS
ncbi:sulfur carrier protein ThiS adenylyltransferase ThiF [bacterium]|nr:sulfur carrier protein ThiS adenylyltransferase ThiF [candidate division CSSED10-310 bacterium]